MCDTILLYHTYNQTYIYVRCDRTLIMNANASPLKVNHAMSSFLQVIDLTSLTPKDVFTRK